MKTPMTLAALALIAFTGIAAKEPPVRSPKAQAALDKALAGRTAGKPQGCVSMMELRNSRIIDSNTILFEGSGGKLWRNDLGGRGCPGLSPDRTIVLKTSISQYCSADIFQIYDAPSRMQVGACGFGPFVPYSRPAKAQ